jgi:hypothetical protein
VADKGWSRVESFLGTWRWLLYNQYWWICSRDSLTAAGGLPVVSVSVSGVAGCGRLSSSPASVSLPDRQGAEDGVGSSSVDTCGLFSSSSTSCVGSVVKKTLSRTSGTGSGTSAAPCSRPLSLREEALRLELRAVAAAAGSAERVLLAAVLALASEVVSVSVCECKVAGADCLRRKKGRDSEKRTMVKVNWCYYNCGLWSPRDETGIAELVGRMVSLWAM